jgi:superfamily II DNA or RNA helicase
VEYLSFLKEVNTIIYDECQHVQALTFFEPIFYTDFDKLHRIVGYSGSPFRNYKSPYQDLDDFRTIAILGEPAFVYKMKDTVSDGNIAQPYGYFINFKNEPGYVPNQFADNYFMQYRANITYNKNRNTAGLEMLKFLDKYGIKTLASYNNIKPGQKMMKSLAELGIKALFICGDETIYEWKPTKRGSLKLEERKGTPKDVRKALEEDGYNIIFGSTVLDEGVDIDIFQAAVLFSAGKTPIAGIQRIGRASRKKKDGMNVSLVIDFKDEGGYYVFQEHYNRRKQMMYDSGVKIFTNVLDFINLVKEISENKK